MTSTEHPLLVGIRDGVAETGTHSTHWGALRREVFAATSWGGLQAWCADNALACELAYSQSSRKAEVQFRRLKAREAAPAPVAVQA